MSKLQLAPGLLSDGFCCGRETSQSLINTALTSPHLSPLKQRSFRWAGTSIPGVSLHSWPLGKTKCTNPTCPMLSEAVGGDFFFFFFCFPREHRFAARNILEQEEHRRATAAVVSGWEWVWGVCASATEINQRCRCNIWKGTILLVKLSKLIIHWIMQSNGFHL